MSKKAHLERLEAATAQRADEFISAARAAGMNVLSFNGGRHLRAIGIRAVDFWPRTGSWWLVGSTGGGSKDKAELLRVVEGNHIRDFKEPQCNCP